MVVQGHAENHKNSIRQDSKNGPSSYYAGYEIDSTAAMDMLLNLTPFYLVIMAEARMALYGLHILKQPDDPKTDSGLLSIWKNVSDPILEMRSDYTIPVYYYSQIFNVVIDWDYWSNKDPVLP